MRRLSIATLVLLSHVPLMGGSCDAPVTGLADPPKRCMVPPERIAKISAGQSITDHDGENIKARKREASKTWCLQKYIRTATEN